MATVFDLDFNANIEYARRTSLVESVNQQFRFSEAHSVPAQIQIVDAYPRLLEMEALLGMIRYHAPWAMFMPPRKFYEQRRPSFTSYRVVPSLGSLEKQAADYAKITGYPAKTPKTKLEMRAIASCLEMVDQINEWISHVVGRIGQFLQG
ncbi:MAG: DUF5399 family protein [Chlamydiota bacterium]